MNRRAPVIHELGAVYDFDAMMQPFVDPEFSGWAPRLTLERTSSRSQAHTTYERSVNKESTVMVCHFYREPRIDETTPGRCANPASKGES